MAWARGERGPGAVALLFVLGVVAWFQAPFLLDRAIVVERDALSSILPMRAFLAEALRDGSWPMWNPSPVLGKPFLAEWQTGLFYPPTALLLVPPFSRGFNLFFVFHYAFTALGSFLFLRALGTRPGAAALGALVWALGGPLISLGHLLNHLMAISWLPWIAWSWVRFEQSRLRLPLTTVFVATSLLGGSPEMALLAGALLLLLARDVRALAVLPLAALLAAMQLLPVWHYLAATHRGVVGLDAQDVLAYSSPPQRLTEWALHSAPDAQAFLPNLYVGPIALALAAVALVLTAARVRGLVLLAGLSLIALALGSHTPLLPGLYRLLPAVDLLRYPEKLLIGVHALVALGAAWGLSGLADRLPRNIAVPLSLVLLAATAADLTHANQGTLLRLPPDAVLAPPAIVRAMRPPTSSIADGPVRYYANTTNAPTAGSPAGAIALDRALLFAATGELFGLANLNTPGSLNLVAHERLHRALESRSTGDALSALGALGTRWVTSFVDLGAQAPEPDGVFDDGVRLYSLRQTPHRAFVARHLVAAEDPEDALRLFLSAPAESRATTAVVEGFAGITATGSDSVTSRLRWVEAGNDHLALEVAIDKPALLVVNDTYLEGWHARIDGLPTPIERVNGLVRGIWLSGGQHRVTLDYRPPGLALGLALSLATAMALVLLVYRAGQ